jgi:hypothetical protein
MIEQLTTNNESSQACDPELPVETVSECRIETKPTTQSHATSVQCLGVDFVTQNSLRNSNYHSRLVKDAGSDLHPIAKSGTENYTIPSVSLESRGDHVSVATSCANPESRESDGSSAGRLEPRLKVESVKTSDSLDQCCPTQHSDSVCESSQSQLLQAAKSAEQHEDAALLQTAGTSPGCTSK